VLLEEGKDEGRDLVVAHLTDPHVFVPRALTLSALSDKRLLGGVNALLFRRRKYRREVLEAAFDALGRIRPDHLVITGDITTLGARAELEVFGELLAKLPLGPGQVTLVPGNHDAYLTSLVKARYVQELLGPYMTSDPPFEGEAWPRVRIRGDLAIIACNTARPSGPFLALGTLGKGQLERLEELLGDPRVAGRFRLLALHHPPQSGAGHWHNRLTDARALGRVLVRQGAELVLHGHLHRDLEGTMEGPDEAIPVRGAASASSLDEGEGRRGAFWLYKISGRKLVGLERWTYESGSFAPGAR
jgi:3',5'-cyclic AMP phosphodiesterase CpdA